MKYEKILLISNLLANVATIPGHSFGMNMFIEHWMQDFNLSRILFSLLWLLSCLISGIYVAFFGSLLDSYGTRKTSFVLYPLFVIALYSLYFIQNVYLFAFIICCIRILGPETISMITYVSYTQWFPKNVGKVFSLLGLINSLLLFSPMLLNYYITVYGWRTAFLYLSIGMNICLIPSFVTMQNKDILHEESTEERSSNTNAKDFKEVIKMPLYWYMICNGCLLNIFNLGFNINILKFIRMYYGEDTQTLNYIYSSCTLGVCISSTIIGYIYDKYSIKKNISILCGLELLFAINGVVLPFCYHTFALTVVCFLYGLCVGSVSVSYDILYPKMYGTKAIGSIVSLHDGIVLFCGGIGPLLFNVTLLYVSTYTSIIIAICVLKIALTILIFYKK